LRQQESTLKGLGVRVAIITFQGGVFVNSYVDETHTDWPILIDESRSLYHAFGMERGRLWDTWGPPSWWVYIKLLARGRRLRRVSGDTLQLGGDILIDPQGIVRLHHVGSGPADRPSVGQLLSVVRQSSSRSSSASG
jgi:hypothetical protein